MTNITIPSTDMRVLLDVAEGFTAEHGLDSVGRYAMPEDVQRAIATVRAAIGRTNVIAGS